MPPVVPGATVIVPSAFMVMLPATGAVVRPRAVPFWLVPVRFRSTVLRLTATPLSVSLPSTVAVLPPAALLIGP